MDAYDTIKRYYTDGFPLCDLKEFMGQMDPSDFSNGVFRDEVDDDESIGESLKKLCCSCRRKGQNDDNNAPTGYTSLEPNPIVSYS